MKKLVFILMMFVSIFSFAEMKDGTYSAEKNYDSEWKSIVKITVKRDKIIGAQFDRQNKNGQSLSLNKDDFRDSALNSSINFLALSCSLFFIAVLASVIFIKRLLYDSFATIVLKNGELKLKRTIKAKIILVK